MSQAFHDLVGVVVRLRSPGGCPWDRQQTHESLKSFLLEETYETLDAIDRRDPQHLREELGDLLLQILLHACIACEQHHFDIEDVMREVTRKLIRRHPHVFDARAPAEPALNAGQVAAQWEDIKRQERAARHEDDSVMAGLPAALPALLRAFYMQQRAARTGFDWETPAQVDAQLIEELEELKAETAGAARTPAAVEHEVGDVLFTAANVARWLGVNPEEALYKANRRFLSRFQHMERHAAHTGTSLHSMTAGERDTLWEAAKRQERRDIPPSTPAGRPAP